MGRPPRRTRTLLVATAPANGQRMVEVMRVERDLNAAPVAQPTEGIPPRRSIEGSGPLRG
jgi:hypothetical protein